MFRFLSSLVDRCIFTLAFIVGVQFPEFIQQYSQRLSGHLNEALQQLDQFQFIANRHFEGNLSAMVQKYTSNIEPSISETGDLILETSNRVLNLEAHLKSLEQPDYFNRLYAFATEYDLDMAEATLQQFQLAIPLDFMALASGAILALGIMIIIYSTIGCCRFVKKCLHRKPPVVESVESEVA